MADIRVVMKPLVDLEAEFIGAALVRDDSGTWVVLKMQTKYGAAEVRMRQEVAGTVGEKLIKGSKA